MSREEERVIIIIAIAYIIANVILYQIYKSQKERKVFHAIASVADNIILIAVASWIAYKKNPYLVVIVFACEYTKS